MGAVRIPLLSQISSSTAGYIQRRFSIYSRCKCFWPLKYVIFISDIFSFFDRVNVIGDLISGLHFIDWEFACSAFLFHSGSRPTYSRKTDMDLSFSVHDKWALGLLFTFKLLISRISLRSCIPLLSETKHLLFGHGVCKRCGRQGSHRIIEERWYCSSLFITCSLSCAEKKMVRRQKLVTYGCCI